MKLYLLHVARVANCIVLQATKIDFAICPEVGKVIPRLSGKGIPPKYIQK